MEFPNLLIFKSIFQFYQEGIGICIQFVFAKTYKEHKMQTGWSWGNPQEALQILSNACCTALRSCLLHGHTRNTLFS